MRYLSGLLTATVLLLSLAASAQRRSVGDVVLMPEVQAEVALKGDDYLLAGFTLAAPIPGPPGTFTSGQLRLGYEHFYNERWSIGGTLRLLGGEFGGYGEVIGLGGNFTPGLLLRHRGKVGAFNFGQRLGLEYAIEFPGAGDNDRGLVRLRFDVDREFSLGEKVSLRPRLAYEPAAYLRFQRTPDGAARERVVDFGNLRGEVGLRLSPLLDLTPWGGFQSVYTNSLPQFDANNNQVGGGRSNFVSPVLGLDVRLTLNRGAASAERRQLPTQH